MWNVSLLAKRFVEILPGRVGGLEDLLCRSMCPNRAEGTEEINLFAFLCDGRAAKAKDCRCQAD